MTQPLSKKIMCTVTPSAPPEHPLVRPDFIEILKTENNKLYRRLSAKSYKPFIWLLRKIIDEPLLYRVLQHIDGCNRRKPVPSKQERLQHMLIDGLKLKLSIVGMDNLPKTVTAEQTLLFAANHNLGIIDGLALVKTLCQRYGDARILANRLVLHTQVMNDCFIPVGVFQRTQRTENINIEAFYKSKLPICIFPAGLVARKHKDGSMLEMPWKKHFLTKAIQYQRAIVPTYIQAENSKLFYRIHRLRQTLGININLEMFLLLREAFSKPKSINITFAAPIAPERLTAYLDQSNVEYNQALTKLSQLLQLHVTSGLQTPLPF